MRWIMNLLFGKDRNAIAETVEVFRPNAENQAQRTADYNSAALAQFAAEFSSQGNWFDSLINGLNRLPRPLMAFGTIWLFYFAVKDPIEFAAIMTALAAVPPEMWYLLGAIVSFYFGARELSKARDFRKSVATSAAMVPQIVENITEIRSLHSASPSVAATNGDAEAELTATEPTDNPALRDWARESK